MVDSDGYCPVVYAVDAAEEDTEEDGKRGEDGNEADEGNFLSFGHVFVTHTLVETEEGLSGEEGDDGLFEDSKTGIHLI